MSVCPVSSHQTSETTQMHETSETRENESMAVWDCGSPLYDSYELVSLNHLIERHLMALPTLGGSKRHHTNTTTKFYYPYNASSNVVGSNISDAKGSSSSSSSVVGTLSEFVARKLWKKGVGGQRKDKRKSSKIGACGFPDRFGFWKN
ncbi:hypothetical protein ACOSP7_000864 [Xanthoceras sorbifolium]